MTNPESIKTLRVNIKELPNNKLTLTQLWLLRQAITDNPSWLFTACEVALALNVSTETVRRWARNDKVVHTTVGQFKKEYRYSGAVISEFLPLYPIPDDYELV